MTEPHRPQVNPPPPPTPQQNTQQTQQPPPLPLVLPIAPVPASPHLQQARIGAVLYDLLLRGGPQSEPLIAQLSASYPSAALIAQDYANYFHSLTLLPPSRHHVAYGARFSLHRGDFVLRHIRPSSVAWFCFFAGAIVAAANLLLIFALAAASVLANAAQNELAVKVVQFVAAQTIGEGTFRQLYASLRALLTDHNQIVAFGDQRLIQADWLPSYLCAAILLTPLSVAVACFILGGLAAVSVNFALRAAGGIRFQNHDD